MHWYEVVLRGLAGLLIFLSGYLAGRRDDGEWSCGWQWPPQFGYVNMFYDRVLHLGPFWIERLSWD